MSICIVDTSIFANLLRVPGKDQDMGAVHRQMREHIEQGVALLLPMATIIETGNHIAHILDGNLRHQTAERFARQVREAISGKSPFTPTPPILPEELLDWLDDFADSAMRHVGMADLSMIKEYEKQCALHPRRRVFIWSLDSHLRRYDRPATL